MKKALLAFVTFVFVFVVGCVNIVTTEPLPTTAAPTTLAPTTTTTAPTTLPPTTGVPTTTYSGQTFAPTTVAPTTIPTTTATPTTTTTPKIYMDLPDEDVEISFWHIYGLTKSALLDELIEEFEAMFPNVTIVSTSQSTYTTLRDTVNQAIMVNQAPTMALGYPDHFAMYLTANAVQKLDNYINSNVVYEVTDSASSIFGEYVPVSLDLEDFVPGYLEENNQFSGIYYSLPFSKSSEVVAVNRTVLKNHVAAIRAAGIEISDNGFLSHDQPLTLAQLQTLTPILVNATASTNVSAFKCGYLMNYDSSANMFINFSRLLNAPYTNTAGDILINNQTTKDMLNYINALFTARTFVLPTVWGEDYGSANFKNGDVCMTVTSSAGVSYNIPSSADTQANLKFGIFDVDYIGVPQSVGLENNNTPVTLNGGSTPYTFTGSLSAVQQGGNVGIFNKATTNEKLFAWLFIKWLTTSENSARWAMDTGYLPVRMSSYVSDVEIDLTSTYSTTFVDFMGIAQEYWANDGVVDWPITSEKWDYLHNSMVTNICAEQTGYYRFDPGFAAKSRSAGSAKARDEAGDCLERIYSKEYSPEQALAIMLNQLVW